LRAYHNASQTKADQAHLKWYGLDLDSMTEMVRRSTDESDTSQPRQRITL